MSSTFLDKFSPEIRAIIYHKVFGSSEAIRPIGKRLRNFFEMYDEMNDSDVEEVEEDENGKLSFPEGYIHTSILATNKLVFAEAVEVFYSTQVIRGTVRRIEDLFRKQNVSFQKNVRRVEITECKHHDTQHPLRPVLETLSKLPRTCSTIILADEFSIVHGYSTSTAAPLSVSQFVHNAGLGNVTCTDIGQYRLQGKLKDVHIVHRQLVSLWPAVRDTPQDYNGLDDALAIIDKLETSEYGHNVSAWASQTSLRCWVDIQQQFIALVNSGKWRELTQKKDSDAPFNDEYEESMFVFFANVDNATRFRLHLFRRIREGAHVLKNLQPGNDSEVLDEVSEFLACNIADEYTLCLIKWAKHCDGKTTLELEVEQHKIALSGGLSEDFILDPSRNALIASNNLIERATAICWLEGESWSSLHRLEDLENPAARLKQLTHLYMAVKPFRMQPEHSIAGYRDAREQWSQDLLQRYIIASDQSGGVNRNMLNRASLHDLQTVVGTVMEIVSNWDYNGFKKKFARDDDPPEDFDADLDPDLGWKYGKLLATAAQRFLSRGRVTKTLASQWAKESSMWDSSGYHSR